MFPKLKVKDSDTYICHASNGDINATEKYTLNVLCLYNIYMLLGI